MKKKIIVLGCGLVGKIMARDLATESDFEVTVADLSRENLAGAARTADVSTFQSDLSDPAQVRKLVRDFDLVIGALPSVIGLQTLKACVEARRPYCDITFMPEDALQVDELAKARGVTAVVDCGISPGLSSMIVGHVHARLDRTDRADVYVGGLPKVRHWPFEYKAPFSPFDVLEEYTRPARLVVNGEIVVRPALSDAELVDFPHVGTLEAFNTDGLRTLLTTVDIPNMKEKTLRYPGHIDLMRALRETGFFDKREIDVDGVRVRPIDVTSKLVFPKWKFEPDEEDLLVLRVIGEGVESNRPVRHVYDLYDEFDPKTQTSSMARTTAFPNVIVARMVARGEFTEPGVWAPELLAQREGMFDRIVAELRDRGVCLESRVEPAE